MRLTSPSRFFFDGEQLTNLGGLFACSLDSEKLEAFETSNTRMRTQEEQHDLLRLPDTLATLETKIEALRSEMGTQEFSLLTGRSGESISHAFPRVYSTILSLPCR